MEVIVDENFCKKCNKLPRPTQEKAYEVISLLQLFPVFPDVRLDIRKLKGKKEKWFRARIGRYRILFILKEGKIYVSDINIRGKIDYR